MRETRKRKEKETKGKKKKENRCLRIHLFNASRVSRANEYRTRNHECAENVSNKKKKILRYRATKLRRWGKLLQFFFFFPTSIPRRKENISFSSWIRFSMRAFSFLFPFSFLYFSPLFFRFFAEALFPPRVRVLMGFRACI